MFKQGDVIWMDFDPTLGHEPKNRRPALVISNREFNISTSMTLVIPITSSDNGFYLHEALPQKCKVSGYLVTEHLRAVDLEQRNAEKVDHLEKTYLGNIIELVQSFFAA